MTNRIRLTIAYDGTPFAGWQSQPGGNTIQDHLQRAATEICGQELVFHGSGRTDAGVHAQGQVAHVDVPESATMGPRQWQAALNSSLPATIRILHAAACDEAFHAQYSCAGKTYRYRIVHAPVLPPHFHQRAWHLYGPLDLQRMKSASAALLGYHDFARFCASRGKDASGRSQDPDDTRRNLRRITIDSHVPRDITDTPVIDMTFSGDGFLYKMVRMLSAALVRAGQGKIDADTLRAMLTDPAGEQWQHTAPAAGLCLLRVDYPDSGN